MSVHLAIVMRRHKCCHIIRRIQVHTSTVTHQHLHHRHVITIEYAHKRPVASVDHRTGRAAHRRIPPRERRLTSTRRRCNRDIGPRTRSDHRSHHHGVHPHHVHRNHHQVTNGLHSIDNRHQRPLARVPIGHDVNAQLLGALGRFDRAAQKYNTIDTRPKNPDRTLDKKPTADIHHRLIATHAARCTAGEDRPHNLSHREM